MCRDEIEMPVRVLVTGSSGFVGAHCVAQLLERGYIVRGQLRDRSRIESLRSVMKSQAEFDDAKLDFCVADLSDDKGWKEAVAGCEYVLHLASPSGRVDPSDPDKFIGPARDGTLRVLKQASRAGVKKVVMTSSAVAVASGQRNQPATEEKWSSLDAKHLSEYDKSKIVAEKAAWQYMNDCRTDMKLTVINPSLVLGPCLESDYGVSLTVVKKLMDRDIPAVPKVGYSIVDVRDVAKLHIAAMESPAANGHRFIASNTSFKWFNDIAKILNEKVPSCKERPVPSMLIPGFFLRMASYVDSDLQEIVPKLGMIDSFSNEKAARILNWSPRSAEEAIVAAAESLIKHGVVE
eukprot:CAMPEP_0198326306 /NCGR_PEP_ID=MMETSP1450-20131203/13868_1 /TAXON_ID=753684 ORGANISM="Madagascaria erythrocladiodes, Strain CCMP3234" /NCGR_SAMPLE_ID=MMETSP1450 /ASSEMBLY_ACC=CAM_ASM_001115 /LENGTH=348 /DNA_ID=CAMNT_0044030263 /DNA_START=234 /DNA_END=1280 /DNA_ORIENTATION=+